MTSYAAPSDGQSGAQPPDDQTGDPPDGQPADGQPADDQSPEDQSSGGQPVDQSSSEEPIEQSSGGQPGDQSSDDQSSASQPSGDQSSEGRSADVQSSDAGPSGGDGQSSGGQSNADQSSDVSSGDQPAGNHAGDQASGSQSVDQPAGGQLADQPGGAQGPGAGAADDPGQPYLIADQYPLDSGPRPPWGKLVATAGFCGVILKAWEGTHYNDRGWFKANWSAVRDVGGDRYGVSWFRGAYLFLRFAASGADQADAYLAAVDQAGGWDRGDIIPIIDVELGDQANPVNLNAKATPQQTVDCTTQCASRIRAATGKCVMLYGRGAMRDRSITSHMGCEVAWNPSYTAQMATNGLQSWPLEDIVLWQYCGDNVSAVANPPHAVSGFNKIDISVYVKGAQKPTLEMVRDRLLSP
jgi:hypothetical protein